MQAAKKFVWPALARVPANLVKNWQVECAKFLDIDDLRLNLPQTIGKAVESKRHSFL